MRISTKIIVLAAALLGFLGGNTLMSWQEIRKINREFNEVVQEDLILMKSATGLNEIQLRKEILFEKLISSAEELAFAGVNESRRQYLLDFVKGLHEQFQKSSAGARQQIQPSLRLPDSTGVSLIFETVQKTISLYDQKVESIFTAVLATGYQLSLEDLDQVETQQADLTRDLQKVLSDVRLKVDASIERINFVQRRSQQVLWISLALSLLFALLLASAIIRRVHASLNILVQGARALQEGKFGSQVIVQSSDEIGDLAKAFNRMSDQLKDYQERMQRKNVELADSLAMARQQKKELEKINRNLDRFVHLISHDIYGPLTAIISYADFLQKHKDNFDQRTQQVIGNLKHVSGRLNAMVLDLVEMTKITRTQRPFEPVEVALVIHEALERQRFNIQKTSAVIHWPDDFPVVRGDSLKLTIVFFNLIGNAIKYSSQKGNTPQVDISWHKKPSEYVFGIKDNGIGIRREHYKDIFDMFKRLPEAEGFEGSGVGLAIVKEIIQEHGGQIWVESAPGEGSQFFFSIPLESASGLS